MLHKTVLEMIVVLVINNRFRKIKNIKKKNQLKGNKLGSKFAKVFCKVSSE